MTATTGIRATARGTFRSLKVRNYRLYFIGQVISVSGTWMQSFAQGWLVLDLSHQNAFALGVVAAAQFLPMLLFGPWGGLLADRSDKRRLLVVTQASAGALALGLGVLVAAHAVSLATVFAFAAALGVVNLFDNPARQSFVLEMVGRADLPNAVSLNSVVMNAARVIGPGIGGVVIGLLGIAPCFFINAASYLAVIVALAAMRAADLLRQAPVARAPRQIREGLAYVRSRPGLVVPLAMMAVVGTLAYNFQVTLLLLARHTFHLGAASAGAFFSLMGSGAVLGGLAVASRKRPTNRAFTLTGLAFGLLTLVLALAPSALVARIVLVPMGAASIAYIALSNATLQLRSAPEMRGRVMSLYAMAFLGTTPVGSLVIGAIAAAANARFAIAVGGAATLIAGGTVALYMRLRPESFATSGRSAPPVGAGPGPATAPPAGAGAGSAA